MAESNPESVDSKLLHEGDAVKIKKYPVGCDEDRELIFNFSYLLNPETVFYIKNYSRVMFIIRGPPSTGKATLSEMLTDKYPDAVFCCADRYFSNSFANANRTRESIKLSHSYCKKRAENACKNNANTIIVQNTHMRKWEMQVYLDFAALYNYIVIMAITLYRFDCTPQALAKNNTDGLDIKYFRNRLAQWEDVLPLLTGWFISLDDSLHLLCHLKKSFEFLLDDGKFCRIFNAYDTDALIECFKPKKLLYCMAGYIKNPHLMRNYYLSDKVQASYGNCFTLSLFGYLITTTSIIGIVNIDKKMKPLVVNEEAIDKTPLVDIMMNSLNLSTNLQHYSTCMLFPDENTLPKKTTLTFNDSEEIDVATYGFINIAEKDIKLPDIDSFQNEFKDYMKDLTDENGVFNYDGCIELHNDCDNKIYRLKNNQWLIKPVKKVNVKSIFTGLYI